MFYYSKLKAQVFIANAKYSALLRELPQSTHIFRQAQYDSHAVSQSLSKTVGGILKMNHISFVEVILKILLCHVTQRKRFKNDRLLYL